jgi:hypothetical protein
MENTNLFSEPVAIDAGRNYHLSIQLEQNGVSFAILDVAEKKYLGIKHYPVPQSSDEEMAAKIEKILTSDELLSKSFSSSALVYSSFRTMLVPESLFNAQNLKAFLKFHHDIDDKDQIHFYPIKSAEAFVIFTLPSVIEEKITKRFPDIKIFHISIPFINHALSCDEHTDMQPWIYLNFSNDFFEVLITRNKKILLFNSFFYRKHTDVMYFLANILNLFSLKPDNVRLVLSGNITAGVGVEDEINKMFKNARFEKCFAGFARPEKLSSEEEHKYANLLNVYNCVL